ncbi:hypothetical protein [Sporisorium scitamineum]|uniref:Uncharacterized protein n=1 Tax=Sporisorium scitamineum TaxID=49012 RepID=A0A0F7S355_9BASI|nr:hypothetical protein [Sporisorium scitamineum]
MPNAPARALLTRPIEFDRYAEPSQPQQKDYAMRTRSLPRSNKLSVEHAEEEPLFVQIVHGAAPTSPIQSTVRARSRSGTSPVDSANFDFARPQSPFAINSAVSPSSSASRPTPRRCHSAFVVNSSTDESLTQISSPSFYAVARGWRKGVYTSKDDAERQTRNGLDPTSDLAKRRTISINTERNEAQRRSRILRASQSPVSRQGAFSAASPDAAVAAAMNSPPLSLRGIFAEIAPVSPIEEINGFSDFPTSAPLSSMTLLPVQHLADSTAFYTKVLDFACIAHVPYVQAVMSTPAAAICLRTVGQAPPSPHGANVLRKTSASDLLALGRPTLPTTSEESHNDKDFALPPTPDSLSLSCTDPEPIQLPLTSLPPYSVTPNTLSGITVLVEHGGALEALHSRLTAKLNEWRIEHNKAAHTCTDGAKLLGGVQQTPWDAQELHICDLDGHRIVYTAPLLRGSAACGPL